MHMSINNKPIKTKSVCNVYVCACVRPWYAVCCRNDLLINARIIIVNRLY